MTFDEWEKATFSGDSKSKKKKKEKSHLTFDEWEKATFGGGKQQLTESDYAPVKTEEKEDKKWYQEFFQKPQAFNDGTNFGEVLGVAGGTVLDLGVNVLKGAGRLVEGVTDLAGYGIAGVADLFGADEFADAYKKELQESVVDRIAAPIDGIDDYSFFGDTSDAVAEGLGQVATIILTGGIAGAAGASAAGISAATTGLVGLSSMGSGMGEAYSEGATDGEAVTYGVAKGVIDAGTELIFGGLGKAVNALGISRGLSSLDDAFARKLSSKISNQVAKNLVQFGVKSSAEGFEELMAGFCTAIAKDLTYKKEEDFWDLVRDEKLMEQFVVGTITSAFSQSGVVPGMKKGSLAEANKTGRDFVSGLTQNEQKVVDKAYENAIAEAEKGGKKLTKKEKSKLYDSVKEALERGEISTDTIEAALGGDDYKAYKESIDRENSIAQRKEALQKEFDALNKMKVGERTGEQTDRLEELRGQIKAADKRLNRYQRNSNREQLKSTLSENVQKQLVRQNGKNVQADNYLIESYNEKAKGSQKYDSDLSKYSEKQQKIIKKAMESGILNNRRKTHDLVDMIAKIYEDKGVDFDFINNEKLKGSSYAVDGAMVNGYYDSKTKTIGVNIDSAKYLNTVVGHEVTHVLEGTEVYKELQKAVFKYAKSKGELDSRRKSLESLYSEEDIDSELTADLVGDYLFQDADFIKNLSVKNRNLFQKIYDEIKYLYKIATAGSKEARELERVKKLFAEAYRESVKTEAEADGDVKHSLTGKTKDGIEVYETSQEVMDLTWDERKAKYLDVMKNEYRGRTAKFERNGHTYYAEFDQNSIRKPIYGDKRSSESGKKALIKAGADGDVFNLVENSQYRRSRANTKDHTDADYFDYFVKTVQIDGKVFDLVADVEKKYGGEGGYVYTLALTENKKIKASPTHGLDPVKGVGNAFSDPIIPQNSKMSSGSVKNSLSSIANTFFGDENMSAYAFQEADYKQTQGYKDYVEQCVNNYRQTRADFDEGATRKEIEDSIDGIIQVAIASKKAGYDIYDDATKRNKKDSKNRLLFSSLEPNSDYFTSSDISTICDKRQNFAEIYDDIVRAEEAKGVPKGKRFFDNVDNYFYLHKLMADKGLTQPCRQCYVESMRKNLAPMANAFLRLVGETDPNNTANDQLYEQKGKKKGELKSNNAATREWVREKLDEYNMTAEGLTVEMLTTEDGLAQLKIQAPLIYEAFNSFYGQSKPKMPKSATPFRFGELTALLTDNKGKIKQSLVNRINATGGFRLQSYSDFQIQNYTDVLQVIFEAGTLGLNGHAYTKVPAFLDATEGTNLKRNISIFMYKDGNEWKLDRNDSFPYSLDEIYDIVNADESGNTSIIAVSQNKEMSAWIMANDNVGYGIPFHKSGMKMGTVRDTIVKEGGREIKGYTGTIDHTKQQTEVWAKTTDDHKALTKVKNGINIYSFWDFNNAEGLSKNELIEKNVKAYIDACEEAGYIPKFRDYVMNNDKVLNDVLRYSKELGTVPLDATIEDISFEYKGYTIPYGYYKFLGDFGMFAPDGNASPQQALSLKNYDFAKAVEFFADSETLRRNEILQQFANGEERQRYRDSDLTAEQLADIVKQKRGEIAQNVVDGKYSLSMDGEAPTKYGNFNVSGDDVRLQEAPTQEDIAPIQEDVARNATTTPTTAAEKEAEDIAPIADAEESTEDPMEAQTTEESTDNLPITTAKERLTTKLSNSQTELAKNQQLQKQASDAYSEKIASLKLEYDAKKNKDTKVANNILRRIERLQRLKADVDADFAKRIRDIEAKISKTETDLQKDHTKSDNLERAYARIDKQLEQDKIALAQEFEQRKETMREQLKDKNAYISNRAKELYNELSNLKKGVRASKELGYLLDHGFDWSTLKSTLLKVSRWSEKTINPNSSEESTIREMLNEEYEDKLYDLDDIDTEHQEKVAELEKQAAKEKAEARKADQRIMRAELHQRIVDGIKAKFTAKGLDLDDVLKKAKDLSTFATVDNTPQRVMEKSLGYKAGQTLADETVNKVAQNETEGIKWLNSFTDRKNGLLANISKQYNIKPGSKESAAAQMYAEGFYVNENGDRIEYGAVELAKDFPDAQTQANIKGLASDTRIRQIYDETLKAINESRVRNGYPEIPRLDNYFLHFRAMEDTFSRLGLPFNPNDIKAKDLPTDLNGVTADLKPGQPYFASAMHRQGQRTSHDLIGGLERYLSSAKNQIYHIDDIQTLRALRNYIADTYGQAKGLESLDSLAEEEVQEKIKQVYDSHLSTFAKFLNEEANILAGKTSLIDRGLEGIIGRRGITFLDTVNKQVGSNMVGFNIASALTNLIAPVQAFAKMNKAAFVKGFAQTISNRLASIKGKGDGFAENSPVMIRRQGADRFARTPYQKVADVGYTLMGAVDSISTEIIARAKYNELIANGYASEPAHIETDKWVSRLMGDRSLGQMPQLYNSKMLGLVTKFQLEVRNQLDSQFYDTIQEAKASNEGIADEQERNSKTAAKVASTFVQLAVAQHIFGQVFEAIAGYNPTFDIIEALIKTFGLDDDEEDEDTALDNIEQGFLTLLEDMPYASVFMDGGRIPISSALPIGELITGEDEYGMEKSRLETLGEIAPYYVLPGGYGQIKKSVQGLSMFSDEHPIAGSYTDSGALRFPVEDTFGNRLQAGLFGQWASKNARDYFDNDWAPLKEKQIEEFVDLDIPISDYRKIREDLADLDTLGEKAVYISGLDLPIDKKNLLINNIADRETPIDLTDMVEYGDFGEFEYAKKYPNKYEFLKANNISYEDYQSFDEDTKEAWSWAYQNPQKYAVSKAVSSDLLTYRGYTKDLSNIVADKDKNGNSISGSRKKKVVAYINSLADTEYGERLILYKTQYKSDNTYNAEILKYLNSRYDLTYEERIAILKELGYNISSDGSKASW